MMTELKSMKTSVNPSDILLVVDAMTGQEAANLVRSFNEALDITGAVLTKMDGDSRGGAALSVFEVSGRPIKFVGTGEKMEALEPFYPERMSSRILGMGDMLTLYEKAESVIKVGVGYFISLCSNKIQLRMGMVDIYMIHCVFTESGLSVNYINVLGTNKDLILIMSVKHPAVICLLNICIVQDEEAAEMTKKMMEAKFDFNDFIKQYKMVSNMGSMGSVMKLMPGIGICIGR